MGLSGLIMVQTEALQSLRKAIEKAALECHRASEISLRLQTISDIGMITATAIVATTADAGVFKSGRHFAA